MILTDVAGEYADYLKDESRRTGKADSISFPRTKEEVLEVLSRMRDQGTSVTVQGARTGISGGAVPDGGHILNLSRMSRTTALRRDKEFYLTVEPGVLLTELSDALHGCAFPVDEWTQESRNALEELRNGPEHFFSPDPGEKTASLGGMASCNASGPRSFRYGSTRRYIERADILLVDGGSLQLKRGVQTARGRHFELASGMNGVLPSYDMPDVKNAAGYHAAEDMDLLDLFIGSEGTLGIITKLELKLIPLPAEIWGVTAFFSEEPEAMSFVNRVRLMTDRPAAIEFFDSRALDVLRRRTESGSAFSHLPDLPEAYHTAIFTEFHGESEEAMTDTLMEMIGILEECGGSEEATWTATTLPELERIQDFRHAVPESVNLLIDERRKNDPRITKLGTDMSVPDHALEGIMSLYHSDLNAADLEYAMWGHIGDNHVHVNILPRNIKDYERGWELYRHWADRVISLGGSVSAEHGIGKLKNELFQKMYGRREIEEMKAVKRIFDPGFRLNPGVLFRADD